MGAPLFLAPELPPGERCQLAGAEGHHAATVQRLRPGASLLLSDGVGGVAACEVVAVGKGVLELRVTRRWTAPRPRPRVTVAQAIAKGDRGELAVQAMTEVGVDAIVPWSASRSVVRWRGERGERAAAKWRATAREAAKQARRAWLPAVGDVAGVTGVCQSIAAATAAYVLHEEATAPLASAVIPSDGEVFLVVGPEGGIAPDELDAFVAAGGRPVRLGDTVLRTSTAGVAAVAVVNARTSRWG